VRAAEYPELVLQRLMDDRFGGGCVQVSTRAVSGTTSSQLVAGQDGLNLPWPRSVDADIVVVNHGINDVAWGVAPATYADNLRKLSRAQGAQVVFQTPLPVSTSSVDYTPEMVAVANEAGLQVIGARAYAQGLPNWWRYATDGVHGTSEGYRLLMTNAAMPVLESVVVRVMKAKPDRFSFNP
jgi:lysophospholipase L1-like esterase